MTDHHHKVFNANDYLPRRFGLNYAPPQIIIEYLAPSTGKLYHHKMRLHKFTKEKNNAEIMKELYERHQAYLDKKKISSEQLLRLIERLKQNFVPKKRKNGNKKEETKNDKPTEVKKEIKKEEKKEEKSSEIEEDFDFEEVESSMKDDKKKEVPKESTTKKETEKPKLPEKNAKKKKEDPELEEEEDEYGSDEFEDEDLNKLNDSELKKKKAEMDVEFEKNNIKKGDANFQYDVRKEFDNEQYAAEWDDESF